jgi:hypothetical protein
MCFYVYIYIYVYVYVVVLRILKWQVLRTPKSVLDIGKPHKRRKKESEITMCNRMQMYNIISSFFLLIDISKVPTASVFRLQNVSTCLLKYMMFLTSTSSGRTRCICGRLPFQVRKIGLNFCCIFMIYLNISVNRRTLRLGTGFTPVLLWHKHDCSQEGESDYFFFFQFWGAVWVLVKDGGVNLKQLLIQTNKLLNIVFLLPFVPEPSILVWLRTGTGWELLWIRYSTFRFHKMLGKYPVS